jgi:hypothetical protein
LLGAALNNKNDILDAIRRFLKGGAFQREFFLQAFPKTGSPDG